MKLLFCGEQFPEAPRMLRSLLSEEDELIVRPADQIAASLGGVDVLIPAMVRITDDLLAVPGLRLVQQFATGIEGIDLEAARRRGIPVTNIPAANSVAVAELALLHVLDLLRGYRASAGSVRAGMLGLPMGRTLAGKRVVVLGFGAVARDLVTRLLAFDLASITVVSRRVSVAPGEVLEPASYRPLDELVEALHGADVLIACIRQAAGAPPVIGAAELAAMAPEAIVVNVARGGVLDRQAVEDALASGRLSGLGLDVFWQEPPPPDDPLFDANVTITAHIGGVSRESYRAMGRVVVDNVERLRAGLPLLNRVA